MKTLLLQAMLLLLAAPVLARRVLRRVNSQECPFKDISDQTCVLKRALAGLLRSSHSVQDMEHPQEISVKSSRQKVLIELTPLSLDIIDDAHGTDVIRSIPVHDIAVVNTPQAWLDNRLYCMQIISQPNSKQVQLVSDYVYGATDYDVALCFKDQEHLTSWTTGILAFSKCDQQQYHQLEDTIKHDLVKLQREEDNKKQMEMTRLNKKIDFLLGTTMRLRKQLHRHHAIASDDTARLDTAKLLSKHSSRFAKKVQLLKLLQRAVNKKNGYVQNKSRGNIQKRVRKTRQYTQPHKKLNQYQKQAMIQQKAKRKHFRFRQSHKKTCPRKQSSDLSDLLDSYHGPEPIDRDTLAEQLSSSSNPIQQQMGHVLKHNKNAKINTFHVTSDDDEQQHEVSQGTHATNNAAQDIAHHIEKIKNKLKMPNVGALIHQHHAKAAQQHHSSSLELISHNYDQLLKKAACKKQPEEKKRMKKHRHH